MALDRLAPVSSTPGAVTGDAYMNAVQEELTGLWGRVLIKLGNIAGTADAITADATPALTGATVADGMPFILKPAANNTGPATLRIDGGTIYDLVDKDGAALAADDLIADRAYVCFFDGDVSDYVMISDVGDPTVVPASYVDYQTFTASGTWTKPSGGGAMSRVWIQMWGGGGGGHSSAGAGGGGGAYVEKWVLLSACAATETVTVGGGGAAGAAGGNTSFGAHGTAYGGGRGGATYGGGGGGATSAGGSGAASAGTPGGPVMGDTAGAGVGYGAWGSNVAGNSVLYGGGGGLSTSAIGGTSIWGGGGGCGSGGTPGSSVHGGAGGGNTVAGTAPGGGGGGQAAGARGEVRVTVFL